MLLLTILFFGSGLILFGVKFAKHGIPLPLPNRLNSIPHQEVKLFLFECFLGCVVFPVAAWRAIVAPKEVIAYAKSPTAWMIVFLLAAWVARALPDLGGSEVLVLRNSAYLWYLGFPLLLALTPISKESLEGAATFFLALVFAVFAFSPISAFLEDKPLPAFRWSSFIGLAPCFLFAGAKLGGKASIACAAAIGAGIGVSLCHEAQRTSFLAIVFAAAATSAWRKKVEGPWRRMALTLALATLMGFVGYKYGYLALKPNPDAFTKNPFVKSELNDKGLERFRWQMWIDAANLALSQPIKGIGFRDQVVYRIYRGSGVFEPNDGSWMEAAPISGPHNSYLNALARIGVAAIVLLLLHLRSFLLLWNRGYPASAGLIYGGFFYALFNVGLEGIPRSFFLLLALATALKVDISKANERT